MQPSGNAPSAPGRRSTAYAWVKPRFPVNFRAVAESTVLGNAPDRLKRHRASARSEQWRVVLRITSWPLRSSRSLLRDRSLCPDCNVFQCSHRARPCQLQKRVTISEPPNEKKPNSSPLARYAPGSAVKFTEETWAMPIGSTATIPRGESMTMSPRSCVNW